MILNWNDLRSTRLCIDTVLNADYPTVRVTVVDNASTDGSAAALRGMVERIDVVINDVNLGFSAGCNQGIRTALQDGADYVWLLNNDASVPGETLSRLIAIAEANPRIGLISPLVLRKGGRGGCEFAGARVDLERCVYQPTEDAQQGQAWLAQQADRFVISGTAMLIRRQLAEQIGLLDERFFAYWEDTDYSLRSLRAGWSNHLAADVTVAHDAKVFRGQRAVHKPHYHYLMVRNEALFWRKHVGVRRALRPLRWLWRRELLAARALDDRPDIQQSILAGLWDGLMGHWGPYDPQRRMPRWLRGCLAVGARSDRG